jgi:hypothetical protein
VGGRRGFSGKERAMAALEVCTDFAAAITAFVIEDHVTASRVWKCSMVGKQVCMFQLQSAREVHSGNVLHPSPQIAGANMGGGGT